MNNVTWVIQTNLLRDESVNGSGFYANDIKKIVFAMTEWGQNL